MTGIRIIAKTKVGHEALRQHQDDREKEPWSRRVLFGQFYTERIEKEFPLTVTIEHKNAKIALALPFESLRVPIIDAMAANGATLGKDYEVEKL